MRQWLSQQAQMTSADRSDLTLLEALLDESRISTFLRYIATEEYLRTPLYKHQVTELVAKALGATLDSAPAQRIAQHVLYDLQGEEREEQAAESRLPDDVGRAESADGARTDGSEVGERSVTPPPELLLDVYFSGHYQLLPSHEYYGSPSVFQSAVDGFLASLQLDGRSNTKLTHYELSLILQDAMPHVGHNERQQAFFGIVEWAKENDVESNPNFVNFLHFLFNELWTARADYLARKAARDAAPSSSDGVITLGSLPIVYDGQRLKACAPQLERRVKLDINTSDAHRIFMLAEEALSRNQLGSTWDDAVSLFERAATAAAGSRHYFIAGCAYLRCADCRSYLGDANGRGAYLALAGGEYRKDPNALSDAAACYLRGAEAFRDSGRQSYYAKHLKNAGDVLTQNGNFDEAIPAYQKSVEVYRSINLLHDARESMKKAVEVSVVFVNDLALTIDLLEELSEFIGVPELQANTLFKAAVCHLVTLPAEYSQDFSDGYEEVRRTYDEYTDVCPMLLKLQEGEVIRKSLEGYLSTDPDIIEEEVAKYLTGHAVEEWLVSLLQALPEKMVEKRSKVDKLFKIDKVATLTLESTLSSTLASATITVS